MKYFLRLLFIASVLFVLLGLFRQTQDHADFADQSALRLEQVTTCSGILTPHQELPSPVSFSPDTPPPGFALNELRKSQENLYSIQSKQELSLSERTYTDLKYDLLLRTGLCLYNSSRKEILS